MANIDGSFASFS